MTPEIPNGQPVEPKRLVVHLSGTAREDLVAMSKNTERTVTELLRFGVGMVKLMLDAEQRGEKVITVTAEGKPLREIVFPPKPNPNTKG